MESLNTLIGANVYFKITLNKNFLIASYNISRLLNQKFITFFL